MLKKLGKTLIAFMSITFSSCLLFTGCDGGSSGSEDDDDFLFKAPAVTSVFKGFSGIISGFTYPGGFAKAGTVLTDDQLKAEYDEWKSHYITESGAGDPNPSDSMKYYRVKRDSSSDYDTVSEGIGYGMLLALYFDDRETFDGLYRYCKLHYIDKDKQQLMHWKIRADGKDISEFRLTVPHDIVYMKKSEWQYSDIDATKPLRTYYVDKDDDINYYGGAHAANQVKNIASNPDYLKSARYDRKLGSATDADVDIAAALCMATNRWNKNIGNTHLYKYETAAVIRSIILSDIKVSGTGTAMTAFVKNGTLWGSKSCWNPCYFTPAWWRMFAKFVDANPNMSEFQDKGAQYYSNVCNAVLKTMYTEMAKIDVANGTSGMYPDWCNTSATDGSVQKSEDWDNGSDRRYYLDETGDGNIDDRNSDGVISWGSSANGKTGDGYNMMSFNFYYDAVRVPWRLVTDYSWYKNGDALNMVRETASYFKPLIVIDPVTLKPLMKDGYSITGGVWDRAVRDGFNNLTVADNGGQWYSRTFEAMISPASLASGDSVYVQDFYNLLKKPIDPAIYATQFHYYENTVRLLALLHMSGKFINYYDLASFDYPRNPAQKKTVGPLTIDLAYSDYGVYGTDRLQFNDRAKLFNNDQTEYGKIGSGTINPLSRAWMEIGYSAHVGDIVCGLPTLNLRGCWVDGYSIIARGYIDGQAYFYKTKVDQMAKDPGCMDITVDASKFTPDPNNNQNVEPGNSITLSPGKYGNLTLKGRNKVYLSSGIYHFSSIAGEPDVTFYFSTGSGPVQIYVKNDFSVKSRSKMLQKDSTKGADPSKILIVVNSSNSVYVAPNVNWRGTLIAPNTSYLNIDMSNPNIPASLEKSPNPTKWETATSGGEAYGAFWGKNVVVHQDSAVYSVPFDWASAK